MERWQLDRFLMRFWLNACKAQGVVFGATALAADAVVFPFLPGSICVRQKQVRRAYSIWDSVPFADGPAGR